MDDGADPAPASLAPSPLGRDVTQSLDSTLAFSPSGTNQEGTSLQGFEWNVLLHPVGPLDVASTWSQVGAALKRVPGSVFSNSPLTLRYMGATPDFCHIFFVGTSEGPLSPEAIGYERAALYQLDRGMRGGGNASLHVVTLNNAQMPIRSNCWPARHRSSTGPQTSTFSMRSQTMGRRCSFTIRDF